MLLRRSAHAALAVVTDATAAYQADAHKICPSGFAATRGDDDIRESVRGALVAMLMQVHLTPSFPPERERSVQIFVCQTYTFWLVAEDQRDRSLDLASTVCTTSSKTFRR